MKKLLISLTLFAIMFSVGCSKDTGTSGVNDNEQDSDIPNLSISWGNELHTGTMNVPLERVDYFKEKGVYFNPISKEQFELVKDGKKLALLNFIPSKGGSEAATLMGQEHLDIAFCSNTAILSAIDQGTKVKILAPIQTDGISLVFPEDSNFYGWEEVKSHIEKSDTPVKIGYHSPVSAPRIVLESVLKTEGLKVTEDPNDTNADVLLVDLKGSSNLLPSLTSKQVDAWVGPSHHPETAEVKGLGKIVLTLKDFPPAGKWENFPCCVVSAREEVLNEYPEVLNALVELVDENAKYSMENRKDVAKIISETIGVPEEAINNSEIKYTTNPSEKWLDGISIYSDALNDMNKFNGKLKDKNFEEVKKEVFFLDYANELNNN